MPTIRFRNGCRRVPPPLLEGYLLHRSPGRICSRRSLRGETPAYVARSHRVVFQVLATLHAVPTGQDFPNEDLASEQLAQRSKKFEQFTEDLLGIVGATWVII